MSTTAPAARTQTARAHNRLTSADDLRGISVYGVTGDKIGSIDQLMVDRETGQIVYAVISFGGFIGIGEDHYPVPWRAMRYSHEHEGYLTKINEDTVRDAPRFRDNSFGNREWERSVFRHYGARPY